MEKYEILTEYKKVFNNPKIRQINRLIDTETKTELRDKIEKLESNITQTMKAFAPQEETKLNPKIVIGDTTYTHYKQGTSWAPITLINKSTKYYNNSYQADRDYILSEPNLIKSFPEELQFVLNEYKKVSSIINHRWGRINYTRIPLGKINKTLSKFFDVPARTHNKSQLNLIIESTTYSTQVRIPALHYWNLPSDNYKESQTKRHNLNLLKVIFYDEMKSALKQHNKQTFEKTNFINNKIDEVNNTLEKYFVLAKI
jgi:hypothetical protein